MEIPMPRPVQTSASNPVRIAELPVSDNGGLIGITFAPGKRQLDALSGAHQRDLAADLDRIAAWNAAAVVTLAETQELEALGIPTIGAEVRRRHMEWHHWPIRDYGIPDAAFEATWPVRAARLRRLLACSGRVLIHCKGGLGRTGTIAARLLAESGMASHEAIAAVRAVRPGAIETDAQERWVAAGCSTPLPTPALDRDAARDRAIGALIGLAVGDAVGTTLEFTRKPRLAVLDDMQGGGPFGLKRGQWTDDTAMALALADSLLADPALDAADLMRRFVDWHEHGTYSCTGRCFDIGNTIVAALERFRRHGNPLAGSTEEAASGNGALMRLSPVAVRHWRNPDELQRIAVLQTRTTHGAPTTITASTRFAALLAAAIAGSSLPDLLSGPADAMEKAWVGQHRDMVRGSGYVVHALRAAVWAVARTTDFRSAVLLAANLGEDADTTAAVAGQLAGALYGASAIPRAWRDALAWRERLEETAARLFDAGWDTAEDVAVVVHPTLGDGFAAPWMTGDWTLRERLSALAAFRPMFEEAGFRFSAFMPDHRKGDMIELGYTSYGEQAERFVQAAYHYGWVRRVDWMAWQNTEEGRRLLNDPAALESADEDDLARVLTTCLREERFCEGALAGAFESGLISRVLRRAEQLLAALPAAFLR
jgi:ADP-ribosyl-[dinitrogen reductase] hydrolase